MDAWSVASWIALAVLAIAGGLFPLLVKIWLSLERLADGQDALLESLAEVREEIVEIGRKVGEIARKVGDVRAAVGECAKEKETREEFKAVRGDAAPGRAAPNGNPPAAGGEAGQSPADVTVRGQFAMPERLLRAGAELASPGDVAAGHGPLNLTAAGKRLAAMAGAVAWAGRSADQAREQIGKIEKSADDRLSPYEVQQFCFEFAGSFRFDKVWTRRIQDTAFENGQPLEAVLGVMALVLRDVLLDKPDERDSPGRVRGGTGNTERRAVGGVAESGSATSPQSRPSARGKPATDTE